MTRQVIPSFFVTQDGGFEPFPLSCDIILQYDRMKDRKNDTGISTSTVVQR